jgi:antitoxin component of MazEF toxin-antitoxin module
MKIVKVYKLGNSLVITIPKKIRQRLKIDTNSYFSMEVQDDQTIRLTRIKQS